MATSPRKITRLHTIRATELESWATPKTTHYLVTHYLGNGIEIWAGRKYYTVFGGTLFGLSTIWEGGLPADARKDPINTQKSLKSIA